MSKPDGSVCVQTTWQDISLWSCCSFRPSHLSRLLNNKMSNYCCCDMTFLSNFTLAILTEQEGQHVKIASIKVDLA